MSSFDVGTAFVRVIPVDVGFQAQLQAQVNRAVSQVKVPPLAATAAVDVERTGAAARLAAAQNDILTESAGASAVAAERQAAASVSLARALDVQRLAEQQLTVARLAGADAAAVEALQARALAAAEAARIAGLEVKAAAAESELALASATGVAAGAALQQTEAEVVLTQAMEAERVAQQRLTAARLAGADAASIQALQERVLAAQTVTGTAAPTGGAAGTQALVAAQAEQAVSAEAAAAASATLAAANEALAASTLSATRGTEALTLAEASGVEPTKARAAATLALTRALQAEAAAQTALNTAIVTGAAETRIASLTTSLSNAGAASEVARLRLAELGKTASSTGRNADLLQGSIVGLSRVTAISALGLTAYSAAAVAVGLSLRAAITSTSDFEHQLNVFQGTTGATADQMRAVSDEAKALGADLSLPATSAGDAAVAMTELAKAGLSVEEALAGAKGVLQLAAAAQISVGTAAEFVATELNAFQLAGDQATHVADLLAGASIAAQGSIQDFGNAFQQVSAVSNQVNLSLETTTGALTELAQAGLRGADGGTSLRTTLLRLAPTTKQAAEFQKALGIQIDQNASIGQQLPDLLDQYRRALEALTPVQQQQALAQIFGQDAIRAASILIRGGSEALQANTDAANQNGAAARLAASNAKGLAGSFQGLKSNLDTLGITMGGFIQGPLTDFIAGISGIVGAVDKAVGALDRLDQKIKDVTHDIPLLSDFFGADFKPSAAGLFGPVPAVANTVNQIVDSLSPSDSAGKTAVEEAKKRNDAFIAGLQKADEDFAKGVHDEAARFGNELVDATKIHDETRDTGLQHLTAAQKAAAQKRFKAVQDAASGAAADLQVKIPVSLQSQLVDAQIAGNLQAEAAVDKKIIDFLEKKRQRLDHNTAVYVAIGNQLRDAKKQLQSVLDEATNAASTPVKIPIGLENAQLDAEISGNLQAELRTDQKIVDFLTGALERAKGNAVKYKAVAEALKAATSARDQVLSAIQSQQQQEAQKRQEIFQTGLQNQQARLELAAQEAGVRSDAEKRLIAFLTREAHDSDLTTAQRLAFEKQRRAEVAKVQAAVVETAKAEIDLRNEILQTRLSAAELTPGIEDDKRIFNLQIKALNDDIDRQKKLAAAAAKGSQARFDALTQVQQDLQKINAIKQQIKGLSDQSSGITLADLFKEAQKELTDFGSNVSANIQTSASIRATFAGSILAQKDVLTKGEQLQISQAAEGNALLAQILAAIRRTGNLTETAAARITDPRPTTFEDPVGLATSLRAQRLAGLG